MQRVMNLHKGNEDDEMNSEVGRGFVVGSFSSFSLSLVDFAQEMRDMCDPNSTSNESDTQAFR